MCTMLVWECIMHFGQSKNCTSCSFYVLKFYFIWARYCVALGVTLVLLFISKFSTEHRQRFLIARSTITKTAFRVLCFWHLGVFDVTANVYHTYIDRLVIKHTVHAPQTSLKLTVVHKVYKNSILVLIFFFNIISLFKSILIAWSFPFKIVFKYKNVQTFSWIMRQIRQNYLTFI